VITSCVPVMPSVSRDVRSGELALKYGPSVNSGVRFADVLPLLHANVDDVLVVLLFVDIVGDVLFDARGVAVVHAPRAITLIAMTRLKTIFRFIMFSPFIRLSQSIAVQCLDDKEML